MTRLLTLVSFLAVASIAGTCARGVYGPSLDTAAQPAPREIDELSVAERRALLDRAQVWRPIDTAKLNLLTGPPGRDAFPFAATVECDFHYPDEPLGGVTPKFECDIGEGDVVKVKYGRANGEVYAEVAASRLFWALGFLADRMYSVKVTCRFCPKDDPFRVSAAEWRLGRPGNVTTRVFDPAAIERDVDGEKVEASDYEGWSWPELESVADNEIGAPRAHIDALKLLAVLVQHVDSKPDQQAIVCPSVRETERGNETCVRPLLVVKDLGSTFGASRKLTYFRSSKMDLSGWASEPIWSDHATCRANLTASLKGNLDQPRISEAGRKFLADRLMLLRDEQLRDLFTASRIEMRQDEFEGRPATVDDWVRVFKDKRAQIAAQRCPS